MGYSISTMMAVWCLLLLGISAPAVRVHGQTDTSTMGFISLDCGIADGSSYTDDTTNITYTSDDQFISAGTKHNISMQYVTTSTKKQQLSLRSFPNGTRNCYSLKPIVVGQKYLLRALFLYGNYDGQLSAQFEAPTLFDLHLGVNLWRSMNISDAAKTYKAEAMFVATDDSISVCLINTRNGTPFISSLELRPLKDHLYPHVNASLSLVLFNRLNMGPTTDDIVRYPDDHFDRFWEPCSNESYWAELSTASKFKRHSSDFVQVPSIVSRTAAVPVNSSEILFYLILPSGDVHLPYFIFMHFAELQSLPANISRTFDIKLNGELWFGAFKPPYLVSDTTYNPNPVVRDYFNFSLAATNSSALPPIINGLEICSVMRRSEVATDKKDVDAIKAVKLQYGVKRNWMGDPRAPRDLIWDGLNCSYSTSDPPRISSLNLSSSGLNGEITTSLANLGAIQYLVHQKNLVSLVGYCKDGNYLALIYEYTSQGTLQEHLRGKACKARTLSWCERLRIAVDAAQGLAGLEREYLHKGCKPPLIHRDVKTGNILLSQRLEAKIADFGLSKVFHSDIQSHVSTAVVGTPGYLDPEYYNTFQLSEKSDVYSFGVVLLELITGRPPIISGPENCNIIHWVRQRLAKGNIEAAIDARMKGEYDVNSVWKAADVALNCTEQASIQRPTMADVVMQLKEGLAPEAAREGSTNSNLFTCSENLYTESSDASRNSIFEMEHVGKISVVSRPAAR